MTIEPQSAIRTRCPACKCTTLYINDGHLLCTWHRCPDPTLIDRLGSDDSVPRGRVLTCVYCGHEYPQTTPASGDAVLTDHIRQCEKHPMRALELRVKELEGQIDDLNKKTRHLEMPGLMVE